MALTSQQIDELLATSAVYKQPAGQQAPQTTQGTAQQAPQNLGAQNFFANLGNNAQSEELPEWTFYNAFKGGQSGSYKSKADVAEMKAYVARSKGDETTYNNLMKQATQAKADYESSKPEEYAMPTSFLGKIGHDVIASLPFSLKSMAINTGAAMAGGALWGYCRASGLCRGCRDSGNSRPYIGCGSSIGIALYW